MLDSCALSWFVHLSLSRTMKDSVQLLTKYAGTCLTKYVALSDVYLIVDWYFTGCTPSQKMKESTKVQHHLTMQSSLL